MKCQSFTLRLKMAQKPYIILSLGPKALKYESLEPLVYAFGFSVSGFRAFRAFPKDPCTQIVYTLAPKYQYRDYFKA